MSGKKVGELFGKPIVQGGENPENTLKRGEFLLKEDQGNYSLMERDGFEIKEVTKGGEIDLDKIIVISSKAIYLEPNLTPEQFEQYYKDYIFIGDVYKWKPNSEDFIGVESNGRIYYYYITLEDNKTFHVRINYYPEDGYSDLDITNKEICK